MNSKYSMLVFEQKWLISDTAEKKILHSAFYSVITFYPKVVY